MQICGVDNFRYAATQPPTIERQRIGWRFDINEPWLLRVAEVNHDREEFCHWWDGADVVVCGVRAIAWMKNRLRKQMLVFHMSERWWKPPIRMARLIHPVFLVMALKFRHLSKSPWFHFLPIGKYAAKDIKWLAPLKKQSWQWAYFTEIPEPLPNVERERETFKVLWVGRMIKWKRVETLIKGFSLLIKKRNDAILTLVGDGPERRRLQALARQLLPQNSFQFISPMPENEIVPFMKQFHVYVLPSNGGEGWGAVVNEAMSAGCAVIGSTTAGASCTMIKHSGNGLLFRSGHWQELGSHLQLLSQDESLRIMLAMEGQKTIQNLWSPTTAANRLVTVCRDLLNGHAVSHFDSGPMAPASSWK